MIENVCFSSDFIFCHVVQKWRKFGEAVNDGEGINPSTTQTAEEVFLTLTTNKEVRGRC